MRIYFKFSIKLRYLYQIIPDFTRSPLHAMAMKEALTIDYYT